VGVGDLRGLAGLWRGVWEGGAGVVSMICQRASGGQGGGLLAI
jgi:hypothetical protein